MLADLALEDQRLLIAYEDAFEATSTLDVFGAAVLKDVLVIAAAALHAWFGGGASSGTAAVRSRHLRGS
jgi:hypothetical protein